MSLIETSNEPKYDIHTELMLVKQQNEIMTLKMQLERIQAQKVSRLEDSLYSPALFPHYMKIAETLAKSTMVPKSYIGQPSNIFIAMAMGYQLGFPVEQALQDIAVVNGRPCLWGDGLKAVCMSHPEWEDMTENGIIEKGEIIGYECVVKRKGKEPHKTMFTIKDARTAGLINKEGAWKTYPTRMLQLRARGFALRDTFPDALRGLKIAEIELEDSRIIEGTAVNMTGVEQVKEKIREHNDKKSNFKSENPANGQAPEEVIGQVGETSVEETLTSDKVDRSEPITIDQLTAIRDLIVEKKFNTERRNKALEYFKVNSFESLSYEQANAFISQLEKL